MRHVLSKILALAILGSVHKLTQPNLDTLLCKLAMRSVLYFLILFLIPGVTIGEAIGGTVGGLITLCCICFCICLCVAGADG